MTTPTPTPAHLDAPPELPVTHTEPDGYLACPHRSNDGDTCGCPVLYATTVREYRVAINFDGHELLVGVEADAFTDPAHPDEPDALVCTAGHEWAVPPITYE